MVKVTIELSVDTQNAEQLKTLVDLLKTGQTNDASQVSQSQTTEQAKEPKPAKPVTKTPKPKDDNPAPEPTPKPTPEPIPVAPKVITIEQVRMLLASKVGSHRQEIKDKLTELGANNVTTLDEGKYTEFMEFMQNLD